MAKSNNSSMSFEQSLDNLEAIVQKLEDGQLELEEALDAYEQGVKMVANCNKILNDCQGRITIINKKNIQAEMDFTEAMQDV